ncbi:MAG: hypothetical protein OXP08_08490 [bacterium]|nr:hypothetical protein [bacterium]
MSAGSSLVFLGAALAAGTFGGAAVLRRIGERGPTRTVMGTSAAVVVVFGMLAVLPRPPVPQGAMLPLLAMAAALGAGWTTDTASMRLPHTTANSALAAVPAGSVIAVSAAPVAAGIVFKPPTTRTVIVWHVWGRAALAVFTLASLRHPGPGAPGGGLVAVLGVTLAVLAVGRLLVWAGQAGAGDPVWVAACVMAAASHALLTAGVPVHGPGAWAVAWMGASVFLASGATAALALAAVTGGGLAIAGRPVLAGQWTALGLIGFVVAWKFTPLGPDFAGGWAALA